jgi:hypothetical protein
MSGATKLNWPANNSVRGSMILSTFQDDDVGEDQRMGHPISKAQSTPVLGTLSDIECYLQGSSDGSINSESSDNAEQIITDSQDSKQSQVYSSLNENLAGSDGYVMEGGSVVDTQVR